MGGVYKLKSPRLLQGDEFYAINKDGQALLQVVVDDHIQIGEKLTTSELGRVLDSFYMLL